MPEVTYAEAIRDALREEMRRDSRVFIMGLDVEFMLWDGEAAREFGTERVRNTPISESGFVGAGIGAALTGMRPIIDIGCSTFLYSAMDQVVNQAAKIRYMFGGQARVPLVIRVPVAYTLSLAGHHSDRPWAIFAHSPGLKVVVPSTPYDAKGLMKSAIRDENPVLYFEDWTLNDLRGDVPPDDYTVSLGTVDVKRIGSDVTIVAIAGAVRHSLVAAEQLEDRGIQAEVVDIRTIVPLDRAGIIKSVVKTGRLIVVDPAPATCGVAAEVSATVAESCFEHLQAPILRLTAPDVPVPFSPDLERLVFPTVDQIVTLACRLCTSYQRIASAIQAFRGSQLGHIPNFVIS